MIENSVPYVVVDANYPGAYKPIIRCGCCGLGQLVYQGQEGVDLFVLAAVSDVTQCVQIQGEDAAIYERPAMPLTNPSAVLVGAVFRVDGIPAGTLVTGPNFSEVVDDGFIEWTALEPGGYRLTFENFPYMEQVINAQFTSA